MFSFVIKPKSLLTCLEGNICVMQSSGTKVVVDTLKLLW